MRSIGLGKYVIQVLLIKYHEIDKGETKS